MLLKEIIPSSVMQSLTDYFKNISNAMPINDTVVMSGTSANTTTTYMAYAYNVITTATSSNYAARLPYPPIKGKSCVIVNLSGIPIVLYPSIAGGSINGIVNGSATIPSDGRPYTFFCYENPLPGAWTWTPPAINQLSFIEFSVAHTQGAQDVKYTNGVLYDNAIGVSSNGSSATLTGTSWLSNLGRTFTKVKIYSNVIAGDFSTPDPIACWLEAGFFTPPNAGTLSQAATFGTGALYPDTQTVPVGGTISTPLNVGDVGTLYDNNISINFGGSFVPTNFSYTFGIDIPASAVTKTYKFQAFIEYS